MSRKRKTIVVAALTAVLAVGIVGGVAVVHAQTGSTGNATGNTIMARVAAILGIDQTKLQDAFTQAEKEQRAQNLDTYLKNLVAQGKITQAQADQYKQWWAAKPNLPAGLPGMAPQMHRGGMRGGMPRLDLAPNATATAPKTN